MRLGQDEMPTRTIAENYAFENSVKDWLSQRKFQYSYEASKPIWQTMPIGPVMIRFKPIVFTLYDMNDAVEFKLQWGDDFDSKESFDFRGSIYFKIVDKDDKDDS